MRPRHAFGETLARVRREQGFETPYAFFRGRGGSRGLGLTFANYLSLERGENLPRGWRLKKLLEALGLLPHAPNTRELVRAYLAGVLGSDSVLDEVLGTAVADPLPQAQALAERAARQARGATKVQLELSQYRVLAEDPAAYACHVVLCNTGGWVEAQELARMTRLAVPAVRKALERLRGARLSILSGSKARSTLEKAFVEPPTPSVALSVAYARMALQRERWVKEHGSPVHTAYLLLRARKSQFAQYLDHLSEAVKMSAIYGDIGRAPDSEMYLVEGKVTRLFRPKATGPSRS